MNLFSPTSPLVYVSLLLRISLWLKGSSALRVIDATVPLQVYVGHDAKLRCDYDLEDHKLYSLKWYKGQHEFYRYVPKELPPIQIFPWSHFVIRPDETNVAGRVILSNVTADAEGIYKCEVSTEAPIFDTDFKESNMTVINIGSGQPTITVQRDVGDVLLLKCSINHTRPASYLEWRHNIKQPPSPSTMRHEPVRDDHVTFWNAELDLRVLVAQLLQPGTDQYEAVCISRIGSLFERRATWRFDALSKRQLQDLLPNSTFDLQFARRTQPVVGAHPGNGSLETHPSSSAGWAPFFEREQLSAGSDPVSGPERFIRMQNETVSYLRGSPANECISITPTYHAQRAQPNGVLFSLWK